MIYSIENFKVPSIPSKKPKKTSPEKITLKNKQLQIDVSTVGASIMSLIISNGAQSSDVVLGYDSAVEYLKNPCYFGSTCGRVCNRIASGSLNLNGKIYELEKNNGGNSLHGGKVGWSHKIWRVVEVKEGECFLEYVSEDGEENYPGSVKARVGYKIEGETTCVEGSGRGLRQLIKCEEQSDEITKVPENTTKSERPNKRVQFVSERSHLLA